MTDELLNRFIETYQNLKKNNLSTLRSVYSDGVHFEDPMHSLDGIDNLLAYFENQYQNLSSCQFMIREAHRQHENAWLVWDMHFSHPKLKRGGEILVQGASHLRLAEKVIYHRDYMDMGQVLYEHVPVLGSAIKWIKRGAH